MGPEVRLAFGCPLLDHRWQVENRGLVGHQRGAGDSAEAEGRLVDGEHAEIDDTRSQ